MALPLPIMCLNELNSISNFIVTNIAKKTLFNDNIEMIFFSLIKKGTFSYYELKVPFATF